MPQIIAPDEIDKYWKPKFISKAKELDYTNDQLDMYFEVINTVKTILDRNDVQSKAMQWDKVGAKLKDGKVILPEGFEKVLLELVRENQINNLFVPEELDGMGYSSFFIGPLNELICKYDFPLSMMCTMSVTVMDPLIHNYKPEFEPIIKKIAEGEVLTYGGFTEANAGSHLQAVKSTSVLEGDEYVLNGSKIFITNAGYADTGLFLARNMVDGKPQGHNVFIVEGLENITTLQIEDKSGIKASPTAQLQFDDVRVPKENIIGEAGTGYQNVIERLMGMRMGIGFQGTAATKRSYKLAYDYANTREQFGKPIISFPDIQRKLKLMSEQIKRFEDVVYQSSFYLDKFYKNLPLNESSNLLPEDVRLSLIHYYISAAKLYTSEITNYFMYDAQQIFGGMGFMRETEINKITRDVRVMPIYDGTSEIHNWIINRSQKVISTLPDFNYLVKSYEEETAYEKMLYLRFPELRGII